MTTAITRARPAVTPRSLGLWACALSILAGGTLVAWSLVPEGFFIFRATWLLHPFEQEHLSMARNFAHGDGLTIRGDELSPYLGSEDRGFVNGRYVPRGMLLTYFIYAGAFILSDSVWLAVTPLFGVLGALAAGLLVAQRTRSGTAGVAAAAALACTSPYLLAASGLAFENVISLAFLLWGIYALEAFTRKPSWIRGAATGLLFAAVAGTRADYAVATAALAFFLTGWLIFVRLRLGALPSSAVVGAALGVAFATAGVASVLATNYAFTGNPLHTAYGSAVWQGTASGVAENFAHFRPADFGRLAQLFLWEIGQPATILMGVGAALYVVNRRFHPGDPILLSLALFLVVLHIGRAGLHATQEAYLVSSPPRYLLPVYATGVVIGFSALTSRLRKLNLGPAAPAVVLAVGLIAAVAGVRELHLNPAGALSAQIATERHRAVYEFSTKHRDALFVGDLDTVAIINTQRLLVPRLVGDMARVIDIVRREEASGREILLVDDRRHLVNNPLYSGYYEALAGAGLVACQVTNDWPLISQIFDTTGSGPSLLSRVRVPSTGPEGALLTGLVPGHSYFVVVTGEFTYNLAGSRSDGVDLWIDDARMSERPDPNHLYCRKMTATEGPARVRIPDAVHSDNSGFLTVSVFRAP